MRAREFIIEKWTEKYKRSIDCSNPKGFSQRAHCAGRKKNEDIDLSMDIAKAIDMLPDSRLKDVVEMRFKHDMTFDEIGRELGVTGSRAREITAKALRHLRHPKYGLTEGIDKAVAEGRISDMDIDLQDQNWEAVVGFVQDGVRQGRDPDRMSIDLYRWAGGEQFDVDEELERRGFSSVADLADHIRDHGGRYVPPEFDLSGAASLRDIERLGRRRDDLDENFADGKVKGRSRPGRVKRAGASCQGSVTDLRARAKKYGGERGKMYHWCANMKGGKKK